MDEKLPTSPHEFEEGIEIETMHVKQTLIR